MAAWTAAFAVLALAPARPSVSEAAPVPVLEFDTTSVEVDNDLSWHVPAVVRNQLGSGLYFDSLLVTLENLGRVEPGARRTERSDLSAFVRAVGSLSAGDEMGFEFVQPALFEHARLTFHLHTHDGQGRTHLLTGTVTGRPGVLAADYPSQTIRAGGRDVEFLVIHPQGDHESPAPAVLVVHGHGASARGMIRPARHVAGRGWYIGLVSQPGYGASAGPADLMGPATLAAAEAALAELKRTEGVDSTRIAVWGFSRGATVAAQLAARHPELRAVIVQSGIYDLWATARGTKLEGFREAIQSEAGADSAAWRARSPLLDAARIKVPALVLHGGRDTQVPPAQASAFAAAIQASGGNARAEIVPTATHVIPPGISNRHAFEFLREHLSR